ncbi:MAG: B12-binding domain-containing radical SAM protein [Nanoarchaeota archaeon]|nr:B12-binding domain-containing radical SAM protein [Nanoarchaeota archaeon]
MNILFVYPEYPDTFWSFKHVLKFISKKAVFPPLGLLTIASMLPGQWKKRLVDLNVRELTDKHIEWADMIFLSAMLVQKKSAQKIIRRCKKKGKTVVAGGPAFTTQHEQFRGVDHLVLNEAEITLPRFLKDLENGRPEQVYTSSERPDITKTPIPMWSLIRMEDYATMPIQYSRGCPFNCEFCDIIIMNGRVPRTKTPEQMIKEMQSLYKAGWRDSVFIVDDNFIGNKTNAKQMLAQLIPWQKKHKYPFKLYTEASINLAEDTELMRMMSAANFYKVFLGIETPNMDSLKECGKVLNTRINIAQAVKRIQSNGLQVMGGFIVGFDSDTENVFDSQIRFIQDVGIVTAMVGVLIALPQTRLWHRLQAEGRLTGDTSGENTGCCINFIPKMGKEKLLKGYTNILSTIYSPKQYYRRIDIFLKNYKPTARGMVSVKELKAFLKSIWNIGVLSGPRYLYWKLLLKTLLTKAKALHLAVELAILGKHFDKITKRILKESKKAKLQDGLKSEPYLNISSY